LIVPGIDETANGFSQALLLFIASHGTPEDQHKLVQQLRSPRKPCDIPVQAFYYRLRELNSYVTWLPGNEALLNEEQIKQAFYDAMPSAWCEWYICMPGMTPGGIIFNHDMFLNIPLLMDFTILQHKRQIVVDNNLYCTNRSHHHHDYQPGDECLALDPTATSKLDTLYLGPFYIVNTHVNGTTTIQHTPHVTDHLNIQQICPYFCNP
jgi:hypothetical protein